MLVSGTALANPVAPPEFKTYLDSEKLVATISPTDATFVATFMFRSDEDISRMSRERSENVTVNLTIWLPEDGVDDPLPRRFPPFNDNRVPLILENGVYREPVDTTIRLKVRGQSPETNPLSRDYYIHSAEHRRGDLVLTAKESFLDPYFYKLVTSFSVPSSVVKNHDPLTFSYKSPLVRQNEEGLFYYVPFFDNLPDRISTADTNRYAITIAATPDCSLTVRTGGRTITVNGGQRITLAPQANEPIRATASSRQQNSTSHAAVPPEASRSSARQAKILATLMQSQIDTVEDLMKLLRHGIVLYTMQFPEGTLDTVQSCYLGDNGRGMETLKYPRSGAGHGLSVSDEAMGKLSQAIERLPDRVDHPDLKHLVIVTYANGTAWTTSAYDISVPPDELKEAFDLCRCHLGIATNLESHIRK